MRTLTILAAAAVLMAAPAFAQDLATGDAIKAVPYNHLTLPTNLPVFDPALIVPLPK